MSTIIKFDLKELRKLTNDKNSCVIEKKVTQNLALQPSSLGNLKESIKNLLDYKIGKFDKEFKGIVLSYKNLRILQNVGSIRNDNADIHFQVQADYFIFQPHVGATLKGVVNKKSPTHLGILVHRVFNVVIPRPTEEPGNKWIGAEIEEGQHVVFRIVVLDLFGALPYIRGELDDSSLKLGPNGDDDIDDATHPINVSYIKFDKIKPHLQKQFEDGLVNASNSNNNHKNSSTPSKNMAKNTKSESQNQNETELMSSKCTKRDSDGSGVEKTKSKQQIKSINGETAKQMDGSIKHSKKKKRDS